MSGTRTNTKPVPVMASTPASPSKNFISELNENEQSISHVSEEGDYSYVMDHVTTTVDEPDCTKTTSRSRPRNLTWKRMKESISRSVSQLDLFSRGSAKTLSMRKPGPKRNGQLETIFSSGANEPQLLSAQKTPTTPTVDLPSRHPEEVDNSESRHNQTYGGQHNMNTIYRASKTKLRSGGGIEYDANSSTLVRQGQSSRSHLNSSMSALKQPITQEPASSRIGESRQEHQELIEENNKLRLENQELWEDNRMITATFEDAQTRLKYLQERNKYLEMAMYQEGKVLTDIIKECHNEIATLKATQCELLGQDDYEDSSSKALEKSVREYYISKYNEDVILNEDDDSVLHNQDEYVGIPSPGRKLTEFFETLPESIAD